jgi:hypothetical protein
MPRVKPTPHVSSRLKLKNCIFCGVAGTAKNPITDEHVWSDWLKKIIVRRSTRSETRTKISTLTGRPPRIFESPKQLMGVVCAKCNNEWMSDIVTAAIPAATAAATGLPINLYAFRARCGKMDRYGPPQVARSVGKRQGIPRSGFHRLVRSLDFPTSERRGIDPTFSRLHRWYEGGEAG